MNYQDQLRSIPWQKRRLEKLQAANWLCEKCYGGDFLEVHHKHYIFGRKPWEYTDSELEVLCTECHVVETVKQKTGIDLDEMIAEAEQLQREVRDLEHKREELEAFTDVEEYWAGTIPDHFLTELWEHSYRKEQAVWELISSFAESEVYRSIARKHIIETLFADYPLISERLKTIESTVEKTMPSLLLKFLKFVVDNKYQVKEALAAYGNWLEKRMCKMASDPIQ